MTETCKYLEILYDDSGYNPNCILFNRQCNYQAHIKIYKNGSLKDCKNYKLIKR